LFLKAPNFSYTFPHDFVLAPGKTVKVWARNQGVLSPPDQLIFNDEDSFGVGHNVQTILYNTQGEVSSQILVEEIIQIFRNAPPLSNAPVKSKLRCST
jgi:hypothetical protein